MGENYVNSENGAAPFEVHCPNCNSVITDSSFANCPYCGAYLSAQPYAAPSGNIASDVAGEFKETFDKVKNSEFVQSVKSDVENSKSINYIKQGVKNTADKIKGTVNPDVNQNQPYYDQTPPAAQEPVYVAPVVVPQQDAPAADGQNAYDAPPAQPEQPVYQAPEGGQYYQPPQQGFDDRIEEFGDEIGAVFKGENPMRKTMFKQEVWWQVMLLSMITLGIYGVYYWYRQYKEISIIESGDPNANPIPFVLYALAVYLSGSIMLLVFIYLYYKKVLDTAYKFGLKLRPTNAFVYALLMYVPFYSWYLSVSNHNKILEAHRNIAYQQN